MKSKILPASWQMKNISSAPHFQKSKMAEGFGTTYIARAKQTSLMRLRPFVGDVLWVRFSSSL